MISIALAAVLITKIRNGFDVPMEDLRLFLMTGLLDMGIVGILIGSLSTK